jgi:hypothetical protein
MFSVNSSGWLEYQPFTRYKLPSLHALGEKFEIHRRGGGSVGVPPIKHHGYRLRWPGEMREGEGDACIPMGIVRSWGTLAEATGEGHDLQALMLVGSLVDPWRFPDPLPESLAYHLAVNHNQYWGPQVLRKYPVAGLPPYRVDQVLDAEFIVPANYLSALKYLKWLAEGHRHFPLFRGFDTNIRDQLTDVCLTAVQLFFKLLGDCQYDREKRFWQRGDDRFHWWRLATYLHWVGRTGCGLYDEHADIVGVPRVLADEDLDDEQAMDIFDIYVGRDINDLRRRVGTNELERDDYRFHRVMPDVFKQLRVFARQLGARRKGERLTDPPEIVEKDDGKCEAEASDP